MWGGGGNLNKWTGYLDERLLHRHYKIITSNSELKLSIKDTHPEQVALLLLGNDIMHFNVLRIKEQGEMEGQTFSLKTYYLFIKEINLVDDITTVLYSPRMALENLVGFEVLTAESTKMAVFWVVAPCILVEVYQRFRGPCCLHHQGDRQTTRLHGATTQKTAIFVISVLSTRNTPGCYTTNWNTLFDSLCNAIGSKWITLSHSLLTSTATTQIVSPPLHGSNAFEITQILAAEEELVTLLRERDGTLLRHVTSFENTC
jgi:hypothetical protein